MSSDGLIFGVGRRDGDGPAARDARAQVPVSEEPYEVAPHYYYDQFTGAAALLRVEEIAFSVYTPLRTVVSFFRFDPVLAPAVHPSAQVLHDAVCVARDTQGQGTDPAGLHRPRLPVPHDRASRRRGDARCGRGDEGRGRGDAPAEQEEMRRGARVPSAHQSRGGGRDHGGSRDICLRRWR